MEETRTNYCFIVAGSEERSHHLKRCVEAINGNQIHKDADIYLYWQGSEDSIPYKDRFSGILISPDLKGIFTPRYELFRCYGLIYDYTILIDDDLFMYPDTTYQTAMDFLKMQGNDGICNLGRQYDKRRNEIRVLDYAREDYNVNGGIVFPRECVETILDYFHGPNDNVTEDIFWILLYVKGYELYRDFTSNVIHASHRTDKDGKMSGYLRERLTKPHVPLLPEYTTGRQVKDFFTDGKRWKIPECRDVNKAGMEERERNKARRARR